MNGDDARRSARDYANITAKETRFSVSSINNSSAISAFINSRRIQAAISRVENSYARIPQ